jgi:hypothetical protein
MQIIYLIKIILLLLLKIKGVKVSIINKIPYSFNKTDIKKEKEIFCYKILFILFR